MALSKVGCGCCRISSEVDRGNGGHLLTAAWSVGDYTEEVQRKFCKTKHSREALVKRSVNFDF